MAKHLDIQYYTHYTEEELPHFMIYIYKHNSISDKDKITITEQLLNQYMTNDEYRKSMQCSVILFSHFKFMGIYSPTENIEDIDYPGISKTEIYINPKRY